MIEPAVQDYTAYRNGVFRELISFSLATDDNAPEPVDITGWSIRMQIRPLPGPAVAAIVDATTSAPNAQGSVITIVAPTLGKFEVYISNGDLQDSTPPSGGGDYVDLVYDIVLTAPGGDFYPYIRGGFRLYEGVTR